MNGFIKFSDLRIGDQFKDAEGVQYIKLPGVIGMLTDEEYNALRLDEIYLEKAMYQIPGIALVEPTSREYVTVTYSQVT